MATIDYLPMTPSGQAARILAAWSSRNSAGLHEELERSLRLSGEPDSSVHEERLQLLHAVTEGMRHSPDPLTAVDPKMRRCLDLLRHLSQLPEAPRPSTF